MNLCGFWGLEFHIILEKQRDVKRNIMGQESAGKVNWLFLSIQSISLIIWKKNFYLVEVSYWNIWPTVWYKKMLPARLARGIWCSLSSLSEGGIIAGLETLHSKSSSWTAGYFYISLWGREHFIISRCTPSIIRRQRSLGVPKISDDSQAGCYRWWHLDLTLPWLRNKHSNLKNCARDSVQVTFEPLVHNLGFIGFIFEHSYIIPGLSCSINDQIFILFFPKCIYYLLYNLWNIYTEF